VKRFHRMPFGAEPTGTGTVRFRLWAPSAERVEVCLEDREQPVCLDMVQSPEGWFELITDKAGPGSHYRFRIDGGARVPDPASRFQPEDVHGPSQVVDPGAWQWKDAGWKNRPWHEAVLYEIHVGTFTPEGTFRAAEERLEDLVALGVTAVELMPVADFPGDRNWGYDGVYLFAPEHRYGTPSELKSFVQAAHEKGLMVFLDVVYNHFGPEGNYLYRYAPQFFTRRHQTPWGDAINFDGHESHWVRQFFIHNALYWLEEYHFDGLRLDAVHAILDDSEPDILNELAETVRAVIGPWRRVHLVLENDDNAARYLERTRDGQPRWYRAQWNDDIHHALHVIITGETRGYYTDYRNRPVRHLARCLTEGFAYQGERSDFRDSAARGEPSAGLPPLAFISFLQNHDQVGNRPFGERIHDLASPEAVRAALAVMLLAPSPPLIFMGQEWAAPQPFPFFCDFGEDLAQTVTEGRRREFAQYPEFSDPVAREGIPDPMSPQTFSSAVLNWKTREGPAHRQWLEFHRHLLRIRQARIVPLLANLAGNDSDYRLFGDHSFLACWHLARESRLTVVANLGKDPETLTGEPAGHLLFSTFGTAANHPSRLLPWSVSWYLDQH